MSNQPHSVYEIWMHDVCLYVGMTGNLPQRLANHRRRQPWHRVQTHVVVTECPDRRSAESMEARQIRKLWPANNKWRPSGATS